MISPLISIILSNRAIFLLEPKIPTHNETLLRYRCEWRREWSKEDTLKKGGVIYNYKDKNLLFSGFHIEAVRIIVPLTFPPWEMAVRDFFMTTEQFETKFHTLISKGYGMCDEFFPGVDF